MIFSFRRISNDEKNSTRLYTDCGGGGGIETHQ
jgi:hypothetical protein